MNRVRRFYESVFDVTTSFASSGRTTLAFGSFELALHGVPRGYGKEAAAALAVKLEVDRIEDAKARIEACYGALVELRGANRHVPDRVATFRDTEGSGFELRRHVGLQ